MIEMMMIVLMMMILMMMMIMMMMIVLIIIIIIFVITLPTNYLSSASFKSGIELARTMMISVPTYLQLQIYVMILKQVRFDDDDNDDNDDDNDDVYN